jgi:putative FmdB family regulatory protein
MPTYQYRCRECDEDLEVVQSFTDDPLTKCPNCKKKALRKVFAAPGISFKGSGFYKNDSRSGGKSSSSTNGATGDKSEKSEKAADAKSDTTSDSKTAAKTETKSDTKADKTPAKKS